MAKGVNIVVMKDKQKYFIIQINNYLILRTQRADLMTNVPNHNW